MYEKVFVAVGSIAADDATVHGGMGRINGGLTVLLDRCAGGTNTAAEALNDEEGRP